MGTKITKASITKSALTGLQTKGFISLSAFAKKLGANTTIGYAKQNLYGYGKFYGMPVTIKGNKVFSAPVIDNGPFGVAITRELVLI